MTTKKTLGAMLIAMAITQLNLNTQAVTVKAISTFGPPQNAFSSAAFLSNAVSTIKKTGTLPAGIRTSPTEARLLENVLPEDLMTSTVSFYRGAFNQVAPWNNERGGLIWVFLDVTADAGETVSLAELSVIMSTPDPDNVLGKTVAFNAANTSYSPLSPGIRADGSEVTSGSANQQMKRFIVGVGTKSFPVATVADVGGVRDYLNQFANWRLTTIATIKGVPSSFVISKGKPPLKTMYTGTKFLVTAENNGDVLSYGLQMSTNINSSVWTSIGSIRAGETNDLTAVYNGKWLFVRYAPQPPVTKSFIKAPATIDLSN